MAVRTKVRAGVRPKRTTLPFVEPELHYATKADVSDLKTELKTDIAKIETKIAQLETKIANLRTELKGDIANLRTELKGDIGNLRTEVKDSKAQIIMWVAGLQLASIGIIIAVLK